MLPVIPVVLLDGLDKALYASADITAAFVASISGAQAARERRLDLFGLLIIAYLTALAGGIFRDLCIGALPPVGLSDWRYLCATLAGGAIVLYAPHWFDRFKHPVAFFDALALGFYAVVGAQKALSYGYNAQVAILLGASTAVGGGVVRDILLARIPNILRKEIYAVAALTGAGIQVLGNALGWAVAVTPWIGASTCILIRLLSLKYGWHLPLSRPEDPD